MAAIDKMFEFYLCLARLNYLCSYRPDNISTDVDHALETICLYVSNDEEFKTKLKQAKSYFSEPTMEKLSDAYLCD